MRVGPTKIFINFLKMNHPARETSKPEDCWITTDYQQVLLTRGRGEEKELRLSELISWLQPTNAVGMPQNCSTLNFFFEINYFPNQKKNFLPGNFLVCFEKCSKELAFVAPENMKILHSKIAHNQSKFFFLYQRSCPNGPKQKCCTTKSPLCRTGYLDCAVHLQFAICCLYVFYSPPH